MLNEQLIRYFIVMEHILASPAIWLIAAITMAERLTAFLAGETQIAGISLLATLLTFYLGTGVFYAFVQGRYRVTLIMAVEEARQVIIPVIIFSIKLALLWIAPLLAVAIAAGSVNDNETLSRSISALAMSCMLISFILGTAIAMFRRDYRVLETIKLLASHLSAILNQTLLAMLICLTLFVVSAALAPESAWSMVIAPLIIISEYAYFLYVAGILNSNPEFLQLNSD